MTTTRNDRTARDTPVDALVGGTALVVAVLTLLAVACLVLFYAVGGPFGTLNDGLNAGVGVATAALALLGIRGSRHPLEWGKAALGVAGGVVFLWGAYLVLTDMTGWFLAGLLSGVGAGLMGLWLLVLVGARRPGTIGPVGGRGLGTAAGATMALGLLGLPGVLSGVDDWAAAPWYVSVGMLGWLGTYALYPAWCLRVWRSADQSSKTVQIR